MKPSEIAKAAKTIIADSSNWCKGVAALDSNEGVCDITSSRAVKFCALGAIIRAGKGGYFTSEVEYTFRDVCGTSIGEFNDGAVHEEVLAKFDEVITILEQEEADERA